MWVKWDQNTLIWARKLGHLRRKGRTKEEQKNEEEEAGGTGGSSGWARAREGWEGRKGKGKKERFRWPATHQALFGHG